MSPQGQELLRRIDRLGGLPVCRWRQAGAAWVIGARGCRREAPSGPGNDRRLPSGLYPRGRPRRSILGHGTVCRHGEAQVLRGLRPFARPQKFLKPSWGNESSW
jgi:hypothetical protein